VVFVVIGPWIAPHSPTEFVGRPFAPRSDNAWLGTDVLGRDVWSRVCWGGRSVLIMSVVATVLGVGAGIVVGLTTAYSTSIWSAATMRLMDLIIAFPQLVLVLLFVSLLGPSTPLIVALVALAWTPGTARVTRGIALEELQRDYVLAHEAVGLSRARLLVREVLPNLATPLLVEFALRLTWSIGLIAALSFLGFGVQPPDPDWGLMISENRGGLVIQPWATVAPAFMIVLFTVGTNLIAEGIARSIAGIDRGAAHT
jgi:peptide/nickel transport system permease protein